MIRKVITHKHIDSIIDSYWNFIDKHKLDYVNVEDSFIKYNDGKLIIDLDDLNACNVENEKHDFLLVLNNLKNQVQEKIL